MKTRLIQPPAAQSGVFKIGGDLPVHRLGFGAMRLTGQGIWGEPEDPDECVAVLRRAVDLGINFIDTADSYGPFVSERLIAEALHPYPKGLVIATKAGLQRPGPDQWEPDGRPEYLRERCEGSLRRLKLDRIDLFQLHRIDAKVSLEDQIGVLVAMQNGQAALFRRHDQRGSGSGSGDFHFHRQKLLELLPRLAFRRNPKHNLIERRSEDVLNYCARESIGFIPWFPLATGTLANAGSPLTSAAKRLGASPGQIALAWLLKKSPVILPIPGTSKVDHLETNAKAALVQLDDNLMAQFNRLTS